jgi:hypothetical protein
LTIQSKKAFVKVFSHKKRRKSFLKPSVDLRGHHHNLISCKAIPTQVLDKNFPNFL